MAAMQDKDEKHCPKVKKVSVTAAVDMHNNACSITAFRSRKLVAVVEVLVHFSMS